MYMPSDLFPHCVCQPFTTFGPTPPRLWISFPTHCTHTHKYIYQFFPKSLHVVVVTIGWNDGEGKLLVRHLWTGGAKAWVSLWDCKLLTWRDLQSVCKKSNSVKLLNMLSRIKKGGRGEFEFRVLNSIKYWTSLDLQDLRIRSAIMGHTSGWVDLWVVGINVLPKSAIDDDASRKANVSRLLPDLAAGFPPQTQNFWH